MQHWKLDEIDTPDGARSPVVLHSQNGESRVVLISLEPGQELRDHQVMEAALVLVVAGEARIGTVADDAVRALAGDLFRFDPGEQHAVSSEGGARILLMRAPWPGVGHHRGDERAGVTASSRLCSSSSWSSPRCVPGSGDRPRGRCST